MLVFYTQLFYPIWNAFVEYCWLFLPKEEFKTYFIFVDAFCGYTADVYSSSEIKIV